MFARGGKGIIKMIAISCEALTFVLESPSLLRRLGDQEKPIRPAEELDPFGKVP
jgi:hypothetical protein